VPLPVPARDSGAFTAIVGLSRTAAADPFNAAARAELHARVTSAYQLDEEDLIHVLGTFPLVPEEERNSALDAFRRMRDKL
jgi:hypothetical protein